LIAESGGRVSDRVGQPLTLESGSILAGNSLVFEPFSEVAKWR